MEFSTGVAVDGSLARREPLRLTRSSLLGSVIAIDCQKARPARCHDR
jgi:hypothetical protein